MTVINFFYSGTDTVDFTVEIEKTKNGILVTSAEFDLENEFFPVDSAEEWIEEYDYVNEGIKYEIV